MGSRAIGVLLGLEATLNPFSEHPAWAPLAGLPHPERVARLQADTALRARLVDERLQDGRTRKIGGMFERAFEMGAVPDYEPDPAASSPQGCVPT